MQKARALEYSDGAAREVLAEFNGDEEQALQWMAQQFVEDSALELDRGTASSTGDGISGAPSFDADESSSEELPPPPASRPAFDSRAARAAVYDVFKSFIVPLLPKPQTDGGFKDGDPGLLDALMPTPLTLALPRAERLSDLIKPQDGWDETSLQRSLSFFSLAAAGVQFLVFLPTITHRSELSRHSLFSVAAADGETVGVRDCCPRCRSNAFVNVTDGTYNIRYKKDTNRNGVRFIYSTHGVLVPISRTCVCRNPACPANIPKLQSRNLTAPSLEQGIPRGQAPDGKRWPSSTFSTHSEEYANLIAEAIPSLGALYKQYHMFTEGGCDAALAAKLMQTSATVAQLTSELEIQSERREMAALQRYVLYAHEQQLQSDESIPYLPSPLELGRCNDCSGEAQPSQEAGRLTFGRVAARDAIENSFMQRFFAMVNQSGSREVDSGDARSDDDGGTIATADTQRVTTDEQMDATGEEMDATGEQMDATECAVATIKAPSWRFVNGTASVINVTATNIRTTMRNVHTAVKPFLTANLLKREPGEFASHDHTFKIANRAMGDAQAYSFIMGEDHSIIWHGAVKTTSWDDLMPALEGLQQRFVRLGVSGKLKYFYDDLCCRGRAEDKLHEHPVVYVFPGVTRCPRKDGFHACQMVTQTFNAGTGEVDVHARDVGATLRPSYEKDLQAATQYLVRSENLSRSDARREAMRRYRGTGILRTYGPQPAELRASWQQLIDRLRRDRDAKGSRSIVRSEFGSLKGTIEQMESMFRCIDKGCYSDPFSKPKRMYMAYKRHTGCEQLIYRVKKSESVKNETVHKGANRLVQDISRMGEDMLDIRIDFFVLAHNLKVDARMGRLDGISLGLPHEMLFIAHAAESVLQSDLFPRTSANTDAASTEGIAETSDIYEAHGYGYYKHVDECATQAKEEAARAAREAAQPAGGAPLPVATVSTAGKRATKAKKGVTKNLLNATPLKPSTAAEVELMLKCVSDAERTKKRRKTNNWEIAADLYRTAFIQNCAVPEEERLHIRSSTTAEMIQESYVAMAARHREFIATASDTPAADTAPAVDSATTADAAHAADAALPAPPAVTGGDVAAAGADKPKKALKGHARWKAKIDAGHVLTLNSVPTLGNTPVRIYLRAMGVSLTREDVASIDTMRSKLLAALRERGVTQWSVNT